MMKKRASRSAVCMLSLAIWAEVSLAAQEKIITTVAGNGQAGFGGDGGSASEASLNMPGSVAVDPKGNVYIADWQNERIRKINPAGIISTVAGNGQRGFSGDGGPAVDASLDLVIVAPNSGHPYIRSAGGIALDSAGNLYIADTNNDRIRRVDTNGGVATVVGGLSSPSGLAIDSGGSIYIAETGSGLVRKASPDGTVSEVACCFWRPTGVAVDLSGNTYVADNYFGYDGMIFKVDTSKKVESSRPYRYAEVIDGNIEAMGGPDFQPGLFVNNPWAGPWSLVVDPNGDLLIAETGNRIVKLTHDDKQIFWIAGNNYEPAFSGDGGPAREAALGWPHGIAQDADANIYVADTYNNRIRTIATDIPSLTVDSTYCTGSSWSLRVTNAAASTGIRLLGSSNGVTWEIPGWHMTQADGTFTESGTFAEGTQGSHTVRLEIAGTFSRTASFVVSDCKP
jgi:sugar lactone lactonase YvrE